MRALHYHLSRLLAMLLLAPFVKIRVLRPEVTRRRGAWILASNHISHFDPPLIGIAARRRIDWMAMIELFENRFLAVWLRAIGSFPVDRERADRSAIRTALERLRGGAAVGIFPEGGIRDGARSVLEGAPLRPGVAGLAQSEGIAIVPCAIVGSDRLYHARAWRPLGRRTPVWIAFGEPLLPPAGLEKPAARAWLEERLAAAFPALFAEMRAHFGLAADDLPHPPARRKGRVA